MNAPEIAWTEAGLPVLKTTLSSSVKIKESHQQAKPLIHLEPGHKVAAEFAALYDEPARAHSTAAKREK